MDRNDIIRMAREAGCEETWGADAFRFVEEELERFAALVADAERDRCCKIVYGMAGSDNVAQRIVDAIRRKK